MDLSTQRRLLAFASAAFLVAAAGVVVWALASLGDSIPMGGIQRASGLPVPASDVQAGVDVDRAVASRSLRSPLYDAPTTTKLDATASGTSKRPPMAKNVKPSIGLTLVGTLIESNDSLAIVSDANGVFDVKGMGETLELTPAGVTIQSIQSARVTLRFQGRDWQLELSRDDDSPAGPAKPTAEASKRANRNSDPGFDPLLDGDDLSLDFDDPYSDMDDPSLDFEDPL